jgi:predicted dehydrogenase
MAGTPGTDTVNLGMVGLGGWGKFVARNFSQTANCRMKYICDASPGTLASQARNYPESKPVSDYGAILRDDAIDAVALVTPAPMHYDMARQALLAGKHVYVEKPMTLLTEHAEELIELADERDLKLMVGHLLEYHPAVDLMKREVESGALGEVYYMYCQRLNLGVVRPHENAFWSLAPHDISVILYLFGAEPEYISASGQDFLQRGIEDVVFANLHFADGRMANIHVSWLDPFKMRSMVLVGADKMLVFDDMQQTEKVRLFDKGAVMDISGGGTAPIGVRHGDILIPRISAREPLAIETEHFINSIREDFTPRSDGRDGLRVVRILEEVDRQLRHRRPIAMPKAA